MKVKVQKAIASLLLSAFLVQTTGVTQFARADGERPFIDLVKNTKEKDSNLLVWQELEDAEENFPSYDPVSLSRLKDAFTEMASTFKGAEDACEPVILNRLQTALKDHGFKSRPHAVREALLRLRQRNLIDDVTLMPLLAAFPSWEAIGYDPEEWVRKDDQGRTLLVDCPTDQFLQVVGQVRAADGRKAGRGRYRDRIEAMGKERNDQKQPRYLPVQIKWLLQLNNDQFDSNASFSLPHALQQVAAVKDTSERAQPDKDQPTKIMSKTKKKSGGLSNRLALYAKYDSLQINLLSDLFKKFAHRVMTAKPVVIPIEYTDGSDPDAYELSPQEQYKMFAAMLHMDIEELKLSSLFEGKAPTFDEVIVAAVETGYLHASELDAAMAVDDLWNPNLSFWQKAANIMKKYGSTALVLIPSPISFWASLVITLGETVISKKTEGPGDSSDRGISIF